MSRLCSRGCGKPPHRGACSRANRDAYQAKLRAEAAARTPETKHRVAVCRLPIWHAMLEPALGEVGKVVTVPDVWHFRFDAEKGEPDVGLEQGWQGADVFAAAQGFKDFAAGDPVEEVVWIEAHGFDEHIERGFGCAGSQPGGSHVFINGIA